MTRPKAAASAAAFVALLAVVSTTAYMTARDEGPPPTTTTTTTTVRAATREEVARAVTRALGQDLDVSLDGREAACVASGVLDVFPQERLEEMATAGADVEDLTDEERDELVRAIVLCVPPEKAEALLSSKPPPPAGTPG